MQKSAFSAFGSINPVHDPGGDRVRWFCPRLITGPKVLGRALDQLLKLEGRTGVSRLTVRFVSDGELSSDCSELLADRGFNNEARIPLGGDRSRVMIYAGKCNATRRSNPEDARQERQMLKAIAAHKPRGPRRILAEFRKLGGFRVELLDPETLAQSDVDRLIWMHRETFPTFPYEFSRKFDIMRKQPDTYVMACVKSLLDGQIYAFSNLELNRLKLDDGSRLWLAEFDNSMRVDSTDERIKARKLGIILRLTLALVAARREVDLCHSESRAGLRAINHISYHLGMIFGGVLEKHLLISGHNDIKYLSPSHFENMNVWYLNSEGLRKIARECKGETEKMIAV